MGVMIAPVDGSGSCPAWMQTVANRACLGNRMSKREYLSLLSCALQFDQCCDDALRASPFLFPHTAGPAVHSHVDPDCDPLSRRTLHDAAAIHRRPRQGRSTRMDCVGRVAGFESIVA